MKRLLSLYALLLAAPVAFGQPNASPEPRQDNAAKPESTFDDAAISRNPFLPIGWIKGEVIEKVAAPTITADAFKVTSIVTGGGGGGLAIINGRGYAVGEIVVVSAGGRDVGVKIEEVRDGAVILVHENQRILAPLGTR